MVRLAENSPCNQSLAFDNLFTIRHLNKIAIKSVNEI